MKQKIKIFGLCGSLRKNSFNMGLLRAAKDLVPPEATLEIYEHLAEIPPFNQDEENTLPPVVAQLKEKVKQADIILFSSPEYNYSIPGVLKNAIDWVSRPYGQNAWEGKVAGVMGATGGAVGTARMQYHLRQVLVFLDMHTVNKPEVMVGEVMSKINAPGELTDEKTKEKIKELFLALIAEAKLRQGR